MLNLFKKPNAVLKPIKLFKKHFEDKRGLKIDYSKQGYTLIEVFRQVDINAWFNIPMDNRDGIFIALLFLDSKPNNEKYLENFKNSQFYSKFERHTVNDLPTYFMRESVKTDDKDLELIIALLLKEIYEFDGYTELDFIVGVK